MEKSFLLLLILFINSGLHGSTDSKQAEFLVAKKKAGRKVFSDMLQVLNSKPVKRTNLRKKIARTREVVHKFLQNLATQPIQPRRLNRFERQDHCGHNRSKDKGFNRDTN